MSDTILRREAEHNNHEGYVDVELHYVFLLKIATGKKRLTYIFKLVRTNTDKKYKKNGR